MWHIIASSHDKAQYYYGEMIKHYGLCDIETATVIIVLGGDGFMLKTLHDLYQRYGQVVSQWKFYGINCGSIGFLMNEVALQDLPHIKPLVDAAESTDLEVIIAHVQTVTGQQVVMRAMNEISLHRLSPLACQMEITINQRVCLEKLVGDGVLLATPAGSTAYNHAAGGPILPLGSRVFALTPLNAYLPKHWPGALLDHTAQVHMRILESADRPVSLTADHQPFPEPIATATLFKDPHFSYRVLFDKQHNLESRILQQQFL